MTFRTFPGGSRLPFVRGECFRVLNRSQVFARGRWDPGGGSAGSASGPPLHRPREHRLVAKLRPKVPIEHHRDVANEEPTVADDLEMVGVDLEEAVRNGAIGCTKLPQLFGEVAV